MFPSEIFKYLPYMGMPYKKIVKNRAYQTSTSDMPYNIQSQSHHLLSPLTSLSRSIFSCSARCIAFSRYGFHNSLLCFNRSVSSLFQASFCASLCFDSRNISSANLLFFLHSISFNNYAALFSISVIMKSPP